MGTGLEVIDEEEEEFDPSSCELHGKTTSLDEKFFSGNERVNGDNKEVRRSLVLQLS